MKIETEATLNNMFVENMHEAVFILDENYNVVDANATARHWYGYRLDELTKLNLRDIRAATEREKIDTHMQQVWNQEGATWETVHLRKDGSTFDVEVSSTPITIGSQKRFYHLVRDISVRKKSENALRASENRYHSLIELSPDTIFVHRDEKIIFMNEAGLKLFGADKPEQIVGKSLFDLYPPERHEQVRSRIQAVQKTDKALPMMENTALRLDGTPIYVEVTTRMIDFEGKPSFYVIYRDITAKKKAESELHYVSKYDVITDLPNRSMFEDNLKLALNHASEAKHKLAVLFIEINNFNLINEAIGHANGDQLLKLIAQRLVAQGFVRDNLARFSTDEFAVMMTNIQNPEQATSAAENIIDDLSDIFVINQQRVSITTNVGISFYPENSEDLNSLLKSASMALSAAKESGVSTYQVCTSEMATKANRRVRIEADLRDALEKSEFFLNYQPIVDSRGDRVMAVESLVRWKNDDVFVSPLEFIPIAERTHLIIPLGEWILRTACLQAKKWQSIAPVIVSVNISPVQFKHVDIVALLDKILKETNLPTNCLKIEITESVLMDNIQQSISILRKIKDMGIKISIDDFGTGYSSLNYLRHLPIDYLKIDQSFIRNVTTNANDAAIVKTIIELAKNLGYKTIAEGVESKDQITFLGQLGCYDIQGYYYSKPVGVTEINKYLADGKITNN